MVSKAELDEFTQDIHRMEEILKCQEMLNSQLNTEISSMKFKCTPPTNRPLFDRGDTIKEVDQAVEEEVNIEGYKSIKDFHRSADEEEAILVEVAEERMETIDKILNQLATGTSAYEVAVSIVDEMLLLTGKVVNR